MVQKLEVNIPDGLVGVLDELASAWKTDRSGVFVRLLREAEKRRLEGKMEEGYRAAAGDNAELYLPAQAEVVLGKKWT